MAGFEVVVRPVVFPDIRPRARPSLPPQDDPEKGFAVIKGNPASSVGLSDSWNVSSSKSRPVETQRTVDEVRVYQKDDDGTVNRRNFVDVNAIKKMEIADHLGVKYIANASTFPQGGTTRYSYARVEETDNVEIRNTDIVKKNPDVPQ